MKKQIWTINLLIVMAMILTGQQKDFPKLAGPYFGQKPPGTKTEIFAPGLISPHHSSISVSPDGNEIYWAAYSSIMMTKLVNGQWTYPEVVSFSGKSEVRFYDDVPFVSPDNKKLFFLSKRPVEPGAGNKINMFYVERTSGGWSEPKPVDPEINKMRLHWQISVSLSGTIYFAGSEGRQPPDNIWYSKFIEGKYSKPINIGPIINRGSCSCPFIAPDESYIIFAREVDGRPVLLLSYKSKKGQWGEPIEIGRYVENGWCPIVSPDGKYLFTMGGMWVSASFIEELRPKKREEQQNVSEDLAKVKTLVEKDASLLKANDEAGNTLLYHAARNNRPAVAAALPERGVAVDSRDQFQRTPLLWVTLMTKNVDVARWLAQKDATSTNESTVKDMDGNVYRTVKIGNQVWMAENLKTTRLNDGTPIAYIPGSAQWRASMPPAYCWVDNDSSNRNKYGAMYNWYAVDTGKLAPVGWRVPSEEDFRILIDFLGGESKAWDGLNNYGFTAQGAGQFVVPEIRFNGVTKLDKYWTTTTGGHHPADAKYLALTTGLGSKIVNFSSQQKFSGKSVRCVKIK